MDRRAAPSPPAFGSNPCNIGISFQKGLRTACAVTPMGIQYIIPQLLCVPDSLYDELSPLSVEKRINRYQLKADRADVIIHAMRIYLSAMKWSGAKHIFVPKIGLADGIIKSIYFETVSSNTQ